MFGPKLKYVRTGDDVIIVFPEYIEHQRFIPFSPKSAGFICIAPKKDLTLEISCYGESVSLKLKSNPEEDTKLAQWQFGNGG